MKGVVTLNNITNLFVIAAASFFIYAYINKPSAPAPPALVEDAKGVIAASLLHNQQGAGKVALVEFTDYQCPFCARHTTETVPALKKELLDTGKARYITLHLPLAIHPHAIPAAEAVECAAEQGKFVEMHEELFARQKELATADYIAYAKGIGLDAARFEKCLREDKALARITAHQKEAERLGVKATPALFVGRVRSDGGVDLLRRINGAVPAENFVTEVAKLTQG